MGTTHRQLTGCSTLDNLKKEAKRWLKALRANDEQTVELLLVHGADPSVKNKEGMTAADYATKRGMYDVAELLRGKAG